MARLTSTGVSLRSEIRRHEKAIAMHEEMMSEMEKQTERPDRDHG
jgi:hypothetical protein